MFYAEEGMVASSYPAWLQGAFNALVGLFDRVGLQTNVGKTVGMVCHTCQAAGNLTTTAYRRRITGEGQSYRERLRAQVVCEECEDMLAVGSLLIHLMTQHGRAEGRQRQWTTPAAGRVPQVYWIPFPEKGGPRTCPVEGCPGRMATRKTMRVHFVNRHVLDTVVILEEGNSPHPRCARCNMQVPWRELNGRHPDTAQLLKAAERNRQRLAETKTRENPEQAFEAYGAPISIVPL